MLKRWQLGLSLVGLLLGLTACGGSSSESETPVAKPDKKLFDAVPCADLDEDAPATQQTKPGELPPALAGIYERSCKMCHENPQAGAPLRGNAEHWQPRLEQGMALLLDHTINGYQGMPPLGLCMACTEAEFETLIEYLSATPSVSGETP